VRLPVINASLQRLRGELAASRNLEFDDEVCGCQKSADLFSRARIEAAMLAVEVFDHLPRCPRSQRGHVISDLILNLPPRFVLSA
jgi:hypothetical protein